MDRSMLKIIRIISSVVFVIVFICFAVAGNEGGMIFFTMIYFVIDTVFAYLMRCNNCGRWPGRHWLFHDYCPRCGEPLE